MARVILLLALAMPTLSACTPKVLFSERLPVGASGVYDTNGLHYSLPIVKLKVEIWKDTQNPPRTFYFPKVRETTVIEPDPEHSYLLHYRSSSAFDDVINIQLTDDKDSSDRYLSKIEVTTTDKTREIVKAVVDLAKAAIFGIPPDLQPESAIANQEKVVELLIDPIDACRAGKSKQVDSIIFKSFKVACRLYRGGRIDMAPGENAESNEPCTGVCFRPERQYQVVFYRSPVTDDQLKDPSTNVEMVPTDKVQGSISILIPNGAPVISLDVTRAPFIIKKTTLHFDRGLLKQVEINKPSELEGFMGIPVDIAKAILSVPAELVQLKVNVNNRDKQLVESQQQLIDAHEKLIASQLKLIDAQKKKEEQKENTSSDKSVSGGSGELLSRGNLSD